MFQKTITYFSIVIIVIGFIFLANGLILATPPTQDPPGGNVPAPLNVGLIGQYKSGGLILNTGGATTGLIVSQGNVGIGTTNPGQKLDVAGGSIRTSGDGTDSLFITNMGGTQKGWFGYAGWMGGVGMYEEAGGASIILKNGNVGIGTTNPAGKLQVETGTGYSGYFTGGSGLYADEINALTYRSSGTKGFTGSIDVGAGCNCGTDYICSMNFKSGLFTSTTCTYAGGGP